MKYITPLFPKIIIILLLSFGRQAKAQSSWGIGYAITHGSSNMHSLYQGHASTGELLRYSMTQSVNITGHGVRVLWAYQLPQGTNLGGGLQIGLNFIKAKDTPYPSQLQSFFYIPFFLEAKHYFTHEKKNSFFIYANTALTPYSANSDNLVNIFQSFSVDGGGGYKFKSFLLSVGVGYTDYKTNHYYGEYLHTAIRLSYQF